MDITNLSVEQMTGLEFSCNCGKLHRVDVKNIKIGCGAINYIKEAARDFIGKKVLLVADINTYTAAGQKTEEILKKSFHVKEYIFEDKHLIADEKAIGRILIEIDEDISLIVALGSGTINDISRFISSKTKIPYIIVCTAPSMDGYSSTVSPLIVDGVKTTYNAVYPLAIIADIDIMKDAPENMIHAGFGDILGKYSALCDWKLSHILNGEYYCETIAKLVENSLEKCKNAASGLRRREYDALYKLTEALILSGICIGMTGTSRPASGEEHHISHCFEMIWLEKGITPGGLHGNNVGVGLIIMLEIYGYLLQIDINAVYDSKKYLRFNKEMWIENIKAAYGRNAENIIRSKQDLISFNMDEREANMKKIMNNWENIKEVLNLAPLVEDILPIMKEVGAPYHPKELKIDKDTFIKSLIAAKDIRRRYGVLQLLEDMGILKDAVQAIADKYYE